MCLRTSTALDVFHHPYANAPWPLGWSVLVGIALARAIRHPAAYAFAVLMPTAMALAVVVTANHYVADVLVGGAVAGTALLIALRLRSLSVARRPARRVPASRASPA
jgi:hypothetical protein